MKRSTHLYVAGGALVGFLTGFIIGTSIFEDDWGVPKEIKWSISGRIGLLPGALLGWLISESLPQEFITIQFNAPYDVTKLKDYSAYYFNYNKALEGQYKELE